MAFVKADRVQEQATFTGAGDIVLGGIYDTSYRTFASQMADGDTCQILTINMNAASEWEIDEATYVASTNSLQRTVLLSSSTGSTVSFTSGVKRVAMLPPASAMVVEDNSGNASVANNFTVGGALTVTGNASVGGNLTVVGDIVLDDVSVDTAVFRGATSGTTTVQASGVASGTLTLPAATDTLVGKATTDTLTNKTFNTAGTGNVFQINSNTVSAYTGTGSTVVLSVYPSVSGDASGNTKYGTGALGSLSSGSTNTAFGYNALAAYTTDTYSDAFGYAALVNATGHANAAFGAGAGGSVTTAFDGIYIGADCGRNADGSGDLTGDNNVGVGVHALGHVTSGRFNVAIGNYALVGGGYYVGHPTALLTGSYNVGVGHLALGSIEGNANENVAVGYSAGSGMTTGDYNIFLGPYSGRYTTTGQYNIMIGRDVQATSVTASNELNIGNLIRGSGLTQGGAPSTGKVSIGLTDLSINPSNTLHVYNATQAGLRLDTGAGGGAYYTDINQQTNGVLNITPPAAGYINIAGSQVITGSLTIGTSDFPLTLKTNTAGGGRLMYGAASSASQNTIDAILVSRGTVAVPTAVVSSDLIATPVDVRGYDGAAYRQAASIAVSVGGAVSSGIVPGYMLFSTANTSGVLTGAMSIDANQRVTMAAATTLSGALTYGGVTLSNSVTGTGSMVLSASPTLTGNVGVGSAANNARLQISGTDGQLLFLAGGTTKGVRIVTSSTTVGIEGVDNTGVASYQPLTLYGTYINLNTATTIGGALTYGGVTLSNSVTGTGSMVLSASPTITGTLTVPSITAPAATDLILNAPTGQTINHTINSVSIVKMQSNAMYPTTTGAIDLGGSGNRWATLYTGAANLSSALTYGGVTLSNSVTGTGSMVLSASPALTGTPTAPTAAGGTNTTQIATTAFVTSAVAGISSPGSSSVISYQTTNVNAVLANTWYDGPNTGSIGANGEKWLIVASAVIAYSGGAVLGEVAIHDGTNYLAAQWNVGAGANWPAVATASYIWSSTGAKTFTLKFAANVAGAGLAGPNYYNTTLGSSYIYAVRLS